MRILARKMRLGRSPLAGDRRDGLGLSVARKRAPTGPSTAMSSLPTAPSSSIERCADQNPYARPWVGARLRATVAMASGSPSPASGLLPVPARQCHLCRQPEAHRSKDVHTNPCARPWVGARLRATAEIHGVRRYRLSQSRSGRAGRVAPLWHKHNGLPHQTIAKLSDAATNTVTATIRTFVEKGLTGIEERKFHCPISQIDPHRSRLTAHFSVHPPRTLKEAVAEIERPTGLSFSLTHVRNILLGMGLSRKKQELFRESWTTRNGMNK
jgi:transposase